MRSIVAVVVLTLAVEFGLIAVLGVPAGPLGTEAAYATNSTEFLPPPGEPAGRPPDLSGPDCDNDAGEDAKTGGDVGEFDECYDAQVPKYVFALGANDTLTKGQIHNAAQGEFVLGVVFCALAFVPALTFVAGFGCAMALALTLNFDLAYAFDPLDTKHPIVAVPLQPPAKSPRARALCRLARRHGRCGRLVSAANRYFDALKRTTAVSTALAITANRLNSARKVNLGGSILRQRGVSRLYALELADALDVQDAAGRAFAHELARARVSLRVGASRARREVRRLRKLKGISKSLVSWLGNVELSPAKISAILRSHPMPRHGLNLRSLLAPRFPHRALVDNYASLGIPEVGGIAHGLYEQHAISENTVKTLNNDLLVAQRACDRRQRIGPINQFLADVRAQVTGTYSRLLQEAAIPLYGYHAFPDNEPPTAQFTGGSNAKMTGGKPVDETFRDESNDNRDGGYVGCSQWDFGDPASGGANTSFSRNPTHAYANPGTYTITLTAIDDDGFAQSKATREITISPG